LAAPDAPQGWNIPDLSPEPASLPSEHDGQIHASLSPFRDRVIESYGQAGVSTRPEPIAGRRSEAPLPAVSVAEQSAIPTQRDLPRHRVEASSPPPARPRAPAESGAGPDSEARGSEVPRPTTASIAGEEPQHRPAWVNYVAFVAALLLAVAIGLFLTREPRRPDLANEPPPRETKPTGITEPAAPAVTTPPAPKLAPAPRAEVVPAPAQVAPARVAPAGGTPKKAPAKPAAPAPAADPTPPSKSTSKPVRETIF
jgi:hypothetical protein